MIKIAHSCKKFAKYKHVKRVMTSHFRFLIIKGLGTLDRARFWNYKTRYIYYKLRYKNLYYKIIKEKKSEFAYDVKNDLERTYPYLTYF